MSSPQPPPPEGFGPILRSSPVLEALGGFMSRGEGADLEIGLWVGPNPVNTRDGRRRLSARMTLAYARIMAGERVVAGASVLFIDAAPAKD